MQTRLIAKTQVMVPEIEESIVGLIGFCARVSNPKNQLNSGSADKLIRYLMKHRHWSPFEMANVVVEVTTTRDIARQLLRHRSFSFQEFSQRYADPTESLGFVYREARLQDENNRQNSIPNFDVLLHDGWFKQQQAVEAASVAAYNWAIENGLAKEVARAVLPEGMMESRLYVNGTIRSWLHYLAARVEADTGTQKEHRELAASIAEIIAEVFPDIKKV